MASGEEKSQESSVVAVAAAVQNAPLLVLGSIAWWAIHYSLLWDARIAETYSAEGIHDIRFIVTVAATVVVLGSLTLISRRHPTLVYANHAITYAVFGACLVASFFLMGAPVLTGENITLGIVGAVLSGVGSSVVIVVYGELHARMGCSIEPAIFAVEVLGGIAMYLALLLIPFAAHLVINALLSVILAVFFFRYSQSDSSSEGLAGLRNARRVDVTVNQVVGVAVLTGFAYGLIRLYASNGMDETSVQFSMYSECLGSCFGALLLFGVFAFGRRQSLLEQCLLFVVPMVATGMLFVSLQAMGTFAPTAIGTGGFACFFNMMWYFAAVLASPGSKHCLSFSVSLLFFSSQLGQLVGVLVPAQFANLFSTGLMYLLFLVTILFMYLRARANQDSALEEPKNELMNQSPDHDLEMQKERWQSELGLSPRELEVALLLVQRVPYRQIAEQLYVSENTVKTHARNIYKKAGVSSREELLDTLEALAKKV